MKARLFAVIGMAGAIAVAAATSASAHHSYAMFDIDKSLTLEGTVKQFLWSNPHSWIQLVVLDGKGKPQEWAVEMGSVTVMASLGWNPKTLLSGDKINLTLHPLKDGTYGGDFVAINSGGRNKIINDGGSQARLKERAQHADQQTGGAR
jgi:hypothetical protein